LYLYIRVPNHQTVYFPRVSPSLRHRACMPYVYPTIALSISFYCLPISTSRQSISAYHMVTSLSVWQIPPKLCLSSYVAIRIYPTPVYPYLRLFIPSPVYYCLPELVYYYLYKAIPVYKTPVYSYLQNTSLFKQRMSNTIYPTPA
jgi:hypothetical protein